MTFDRIIPIIDLFAGLGGLSEGFSRFSSFYSDPVKFQVKLSIEKDAAAYRTLRLRAFFRQFEADRVPNEYYRYLRSVDAKEGAKWLEKIKLLPEWKHAEAEAWHTELGAVDFDLLHGRIKKSLAGTRDWVLLGGPPCQAYSLAGRSRRLGAGHRVRNLRDEDALAQHTQSKREAFYRDERHTLYREYLQIVALHQPSIFVMENVKRILSSKVSTEDSAEPTHVFDLILRDLGDPWSAFDADKLPKGWREFSVGTTHGYRIFSFVEPLDLAGQQRRDDFLICSELYGIPQQRHRVILLGIRDDLALTPESMTTRPRAAVSVKQAIGNLPRLRSGLSRRVVDQGGDAIEDNATNWVDVVRKAVTPAILAADLQASLALVRSRAVEKGCRTRDQLSL
jgi:DNA (cytosine-5)-methyltransferase 1